MAWSAQNMVANRRYLRAVLVPAPTRDAALLHKPIQFGRKDFRKSLINKADGNNGDVLINILHAFLQRIA